MTPHEWKAEWKRLDHFRISAEADRGELETEWFTQLRHYHVDAVNHGITLLIGHAEDNFLPGLGKLKGFIQQKIDRYERTHGKCSTCHGATWIDAWPMVWDGRLYEMFARCPDCGIPAPEMKTPHPSARPATKVEYEEWKAGRYLRDAMPEWAKAKPWKSEAARIEHKRTMREAFERLRIKLFGSSEDAA